MLPSVLVENRRAKRSPAKTAEEERDLGNLSDGSHKSLEWDYQVHWFNLLRRDIYKCIVANDVFFYANIRE